MDILNHINHAVWGAPTLLTLFFTGVILSLRTRFFQLRHLKDALLIIFKKDNRRADTGLTPLQSVSTALSGTLGTGNIVGVAGAVALGGPGTVFWLWVSALFSMIIKFSEIVLSVRYRERTCDGSFCGGAMYYIKNALPSSLRFLAVVFALCGTVSAFGTGNMTQINTFASCVCSMVREICVLTPQAELYLKFSIGIVCAVTLAVIFKNEGRMGAFCEKIVPLMTFTYIVLTLGVIAVNFRQLPSVFSNIFVGAFSPSGITGGAVGSAFIALRTGMSRGIFSNEAGLGTAPIAYACCDGDETELGLMGIFEVFVDTVVVCTLTALAILCVGNIPYGTDSAAALTLNAITCVFGRNVIFVFCPVLCFFAFSSTVGWGLYGTRFVSFLFGEGAKRIFLCLFCFACIAGAVFRADAVWLLAEILNGSMAIPNVISLSLLSDRIVSIKPRS